MSRIDFHVHITPPEISANRQKYAEKEPYFALLAQNPPNKYAAAEDVITMLDESHFDCAVVFGFAFKDAGLCRMVNDYVIEAVKQFPDRLIGFMVIPPRESGLEAEIDRCYRAGLHGIGELYPEGQGFNIDEAQETRLLAGVCIERNMPLILHTNEPVGHYYAGKNDVALKKIERFIENSQGLNIILAHWGGGLFLYEAMPELRKKFRTVYYDTAASPFLYDAGIYRAAIALGLSEKILFGSDFPLLPPSRYMQHLETLPQEAKNLILGGNALRIMGAGLGETLIK